MLLQRFVALFMIEILPRVLIWIANDQNLHFVQKYLCFILLRDDLNICGWESDEKLTVLWMFCPPSLRAGHVTENYQ